MAQIRRSALLNGLAKLEKDQAANRIALESNLAQSGESIAKLLAGSLTMNRIKGFNPHSTAFLGYLISHESHHRGEIEVTLTQAGYKLDQKTSYGLWEWGVR